jgi:LEA14-like dessication related protein
MKRTLRLALALTTLCIVLSIASLTLSSCSSVSRALNIVNPSYSLRNIRPRVAVALPLSASTIDLDFDLGVDNPNSVAVRLDRIDFDVLIDENPLLSSFSQSGVRIPAHGYGEVHLRTQVRYDDIRAAYRQLAGAIQGNGARYQVRGNAYYDTPVGMLKFPVTVYSSR